MKALQSIPTNLVMGFLGVGKTTAILNLLDQKPGDEKWAVLVNEFGKIGIDGAVLSNKGAFVKEVPGGCICCAVGLPFQVAINRLLAQSRPDRLIIEPSGLAHPQRILKQLSEYPFQQVLELKASICLVDPRHFNDTRYINHETFIDQIAVSDILLANKIDLADSFAIQTFKDYAASCNPKKSVIAQIQKSQIDLAWIDMPRNLNRKAQFSNAHNNESDIALGLDHQNGPEMHTWGKIYQPDVVFNFSLLKSYLNDYSPLRLKGVFNTDEGCWLFNRTEDNLSITSMSKVADSRIDIISPDPSWQRVQDALSKCIKSAKQ